MVLNNAINTPRSSDADTQAGDSGVLLVTPSSLNSIMSSSVLTGIVSWTGAGNYYSVASTNFTLERGGTGYIRSKLVTWSGSQTVSSLSAGSCHFIYVDSTGTIGSTATRTEDLFRDYIVLFECLVDSAGTPNVITVREDHPYDYPTNTSLWAHDTIGIVFNKYKDGANITLNGTVKIQINGADELEDHGLVTDIPDSSGVAVNFSFMYTNGAGKWVRDSITDTFPMEYNNAGTVTALSTNKYGVFRLYVSKDDLNSSTPTYYAVYDSSQYNNQAAAQTAIANDTVSAQSNELSELELAQLGFVITSESSGEIIEVIIAKQTVNSVFSGGTASSASLITTDTTNFDWILSSADTNVQAALETIDDYGKYVEVTDASATMVSKYAYGTNRGAGVTLTLPTTAAVGEIIEVTGIAGLWVIAQNAGQTIYIAGTNTTTGVGGSLTAQNAGDCITLKCIVANTDWRVQNMMGNITVA